MLCFPRQRCEGDQIIKVEGYSVERRRMLLTNKNVEKLLNVKNEL